MLCDQRFKFGFRLHWTKAIMAQPVAGIADPENNNVGFFDRSEKTILMSTDNFSSGYKADGA